MKFNKVITKELILDFVLFVVAIALIVKFYRNNFLLTILLIIGWIVAMKIWHDKDDIYFFVMAGILGPIGEIIAIHFGVWSYANPSFLGIPVWLPLVWGLSIMLIKRLSEVLIKIKK
tara:strand:- start:808 stop:1158 length:351 start_codon:yes stop_codon:yes gene_type:complete